MTDKASDPFAELESRILAVFREETAEATAKRDEGIAHLESLRKTFGGNSGSASPVSENSDAVAFTEAVEVEHVPSLKLAMTQAVMALPEPISRRKVMGWIAERWPSLDQSKEGTIASTFSRVKADHLEPIPGDVPFLFRRRTPGKTADSSSEERRVS